VRAIFVTCKQKRAKLRAGCGQGAGKDPPQSAPYLAYVIMPPSMFSFTATAASSLVGKLPFFGRLVCYNAQILEHNSKNVFVSWSNHIV
jgi:hypothetical protein